MKQTNEIMNDFEKMSIMSKEGKDIRMCGNLVAANKVKQGGKITVGVDEDTFNIIINQMATGENTHYVALYVINIKQFKEVNEAGERRFSLEEAKEIWVAAALWMQTQLLDSEKMAPNKKKYFSETFGIDLEK